jgi:integrase
MLMRLGLHSGDVAQLRLTAIDWHNGTLQVIGEGRYQVRRSAPQDAGDAVLRYLDRDPLISIAITWFVRSIEASRL